jgi:hypothetical protein
MKWTTLAFAIAAPLFVGVGRAEADMIFVQSPDDPSTASYFDSFGPNRTYDNFQLSASATVTTITWRGAVQGSGGTSDAFNIQFYLDNGGTRGGFPPSMPLTDTPLASIDLVSGGFTASLVFNDSNSDRSVYDNSATLPGGVSLTEGQNYWVSIYSTELGNGGANWLWGSSSDGDGYMAQTGLPDSGNDFAGFRSDLAFTLGDGQGASPVPEPASMTLLGIGAMCLLGYRIRRRNAAAAPGAVG